MTADVRAEVEAARDWYQAWARLVLAHPSQCPDLSRPCHAWLSHHADAASIALDMAIALHFAGRHPMIAARQAGVAWAW